MKSLLWMVLILAGLANAQRANPEPFFSRWPGVFAWSLPADGPEPPDRPVPLNRFRMEMAGKGSYLGVGVAEIDAERAKALKLPEERGVEVTKVEPGSPADKAGLKEGDVVLEYNGEKVEGLEQFVRLVRETPPGRKARLVVSRNGASQALTATLGSRKTTAFAMDPEFERNMARMRSQLENMRIHMPDVPTGEMAWRTGILGVEAESLTPQLAEYFGVQRGVLVRSVIKGSPAEKAGMKAGDVIVSVGDTKVAKAQEITSAIRRLEPGKEISIGIVRNHRDMKLSVAIDPASDTFVRPLRADKNRSDKSDK